MEEIRSLIGLSPSTIDDCEIRAGVLTSTEEILCAYKGIRDSFLVTSKRLLCVNKQGVTGKKQDYLSIPIENIQAFSVETAGTVDLDSEVAIYVSGMGRLKIRISRPTANIDPIVEALNRLKFGR
jgi:hypothetical protein